MRHATDADHVIAVSTIVTRQRSVQSAGWIGLLWGMGHTLTVLMVGGAIILFSIVIPPSLNLAMEAGVGIMLVVLGAANLPAVRRRLGGSPRPGAHAPGSTRHGHDDPALRPHRHGSALDRWFGGLGVYQAARPVLVGIVHGLAGSAAAALLVLATIPDPGEGLAYLALFGLGTIAGMMLVTFAMAAPLAFSCDRMPRFGTYVQLGASVLSVAFGLALILGAGHPDAALAAVLP
ncbi:MAG: high-affinity nickel-transport family protein [Betaproteobacteria bacterium]|nr:high-affinity nickel-transport family protein [Betaproteobacteria bacterium]